MREYNLIYILGAFFAVYKNRHVCGFGGFGCH